MIDVSDDTHVPDVGGLVHKGPNLVYRKVNHDESVVSSMSIWGVGDAVVDEDERRGGKGDFYKNV